MILILIIIIRLLLISIIVLMTMIMILMMMVMIGHSPRKYNACLKYIHFRKIISPQHHSKVWYKAPDISAEFYNVLVSRLCPKYWGTAHLWAAVTAQLGRRCRMISLFTFRSLIVKIFTVHNTGSSLALLKDHVRRKILTPKNENRHLITLVLITDSGKVKTVGSAIAQTNLRGSHVYRFQNGWCAPTLLHTHTLRLDLCSIYSLWYYWSVRVVHSISLGYRANLLPFVIVTFLQND